MINTKFKLLLILLISNRINFCMENSKELYQYNAKNVLGKFVTPIVAIQKMIVQYCQEWKLHKEFKGHIDDVISVAYSPNCTKDGDIAGAILTARLDNKYLASASQDTTIRIWDLSNENCFHVLNGHTASICSLAYSNDGTRLFSASLDGFIKIWDTKTGTLINTLSAASNASCTISISPDNNYISSVFKNCNITVWDINVKSATYGDCIRTINDNNADIYTLAYCKSGKFIASGSWTKDIKLWDISNGNCIKEFNGDCSKGIYALDFSPDDKYLASGSSDNKIKIWDIFTGNCLLTIIANNANANYVNSISFSPCGNYLASSSDDEKECTKFWDAKTGECIQVLPNEEGYSRSVKYSNCGNFLAAGFKNNLDDGTVRIWKNIAIDLLRNHE